MSEKFPIPCYFSLNFIPIIRKLFSAECYIPSNPLPPIDSPSNTSFPLNSATFEVKKRSLLTC